MIHYQEMFQNPIIKEVNSINKELYCVVAVFEVHGFVATILK